MQPFTTCGGRFLLAAMFLWGLDDIGTGSERRVGTTTANFLKVGVHARAVGLGEAVTALADGLAFAEYNPASARLNHLTLSATHTLLYEGVRLEEVSLGVPIGKNAGAVFLSKGIFFGQTTRTNGIGEQIGSFDAASYLTGAGGHIRFGRWSWGVFAKTINQRIDEMKSSTVAADVGVRFQTPLPGLTLAAALLNVGRPVKFIDQRDELPASVRAGVGFESDYFRFSADIIHYDDVHPTAAAGIEFSPLRFLRFRAGFNTHSELASPVTAGAGFRFSFIELDYAYNPGERSTAHRMTLTLR